MKIGQREQMRRGYHPGASRMAPVLHARATREEPARPARRVATPCRSTPFSYPGGRRAAPRRYPTPAPVSPIPLRDRPGAPAAMPVPTQSNNGAGNAPSKWSGSHASF